MEATARIFYQRAPAKRTIDDRCPVKLCITHRQERRYYSLKEKIINNNWMFITEKNILKVNKDIQREYNRIVRAAEDVINEIPEFSFGLFEDKFFNRAGSWDNVFSATWGHIQELKVDGRYGYASSFESTLRAVKEFHIGKKLKLNCRNKVDDRYDKYMEGKKLSFPDITASWLKRFDAEMRDQGKSRSTIGIYTRNIKVLFNLAIKKHGVKVEYPFYEYKPKQAASRKLALTPYQISLIINYKTEDPQEQFCRDIFIFSFLANGMNLSDIARLKYSSIKCNEIVFVREKTKNEANEEDGIHVPITRQMQRIIDRHGNKTVGHDAYIFPVLSLDWNDRKQYSAIKLFTKTVNNNIKHVASAVGITERISSYVARHSFSTILKNAGASVEYLKEALGHSSIQVTQKYLKSFPSDTRREHSEKLEDQVFNTNAV